MRKLVATRSKLLWPVIFISVDRIAGHGSCHGGFGAARQLPDAQKIRRAAFHGQRLIFAAAPSLCSVRACCLAEEILDDSHERRFVAEEVRTDCVRRFPLLRTRTITGSSDSAGIAGFHRG
jgi:hypothetical protein